MVEERRALYLFWRRIWKEIFESKKNNKNIEEEKPPSLKKKREERITPSRSNDCFSLVFVCEGRGVFGCSYREELYRLF